MERFLIFVIGLVLVQQGKCRVKVTMAIRLIRYPPTTTRCARMYEVYKTCGSACAPTCNNYKTEIMCTEQCVIGCQCMDGYVRNTADNSCCLPSQCPAVEPEPEPEPVCPLYQTYNSCGTACPLTCANYKSPPQMCTMQCKIGCQCVSGYVEKGDGSCCKPEEC